MSMEYRDLGRTGLRVSVIGIGTWQLAGPLQMDGKPDGYPDPGESAVIDLIRAVGDLGVTLIDCAAIYGNGEGERRVARAIRGQRDRWVISTKFGLRKGPAGDKVSDAGPDGIRHSLEGSLRRLQTDHVDLFLYHVRPERDAIASGKAVLDELKREGKLRAYGISTNRAKTVERMARQGAVDAVMFSQSLVTEPEAMLDLLRKHRLGGLVRGALEGGRLSGRYFQEAPDFSDEDFRKAGFNGDEARRYAIFREHLPPGISMPALAVRYLLDFDTTHSVVLGGRSLDHYREVLAAVDLPPLDGALRETLRRTGESLAAPRRKKGLLRRIGRWLGI